MGGRCRLCFQFRATFFGHIPDSGAAAQYNTIPSLVRKFSYKCSFSPNSLRNFAQFLKAFPPRKVMGGRCAKLQTIPLKTSRVFHSRGANKCFKMHCLLYSKLIHGMAHIMLKNTSTLLNRNSRLNYT
jgi:hypothetical protein